MIFSSSREFVIILLVITVKELFTKLEIDPKDLSLYERAFSHSSYVNEHHFKQDYERLEFLGDAVLDLLVADYLYSNKHEEEGEMTKVRASYVCENACFEYAKALELGRYIKVGHGEKQENGTVKKAIMADIFEAMIGAIYVDLGYATARRVGLKIIVPYIENPNVTFFSDYKSSLQEYVQTEQKNLEYVVTNEQGPSHQKQFTVSVMIEGIALGEGTAGSKKEAEQEAAKKALEKLALKKR